MSQKTKKLLLKIKTEYTYISINDIKNESVFLNKAAEELNKGKNIVLYKGIGLTSKDYCNIGKKLRILTAEFDALLIVYDRIDIAKIISADGILLDDNTISLSDTKSMTENDLIIGYNAKNNVEAEFAQEKGADFIVSKTPVKLDIPVFWGI